MEHIEPLLKRMEEKLADNASEACQSMNIFRALGVEHNEVVICRYLRELLDPKGSHQMGAQPLCMFARMVLQLSEFDENEAQQATVKLESTIDNRRRVDIVICLRNKVIPIEVKIGAKDQAAQLWTYYQFYKKKGLLYSDHIYYLTPTKWEPSADSRRDLRIGREIILLSFAEQIRAWMLALRDVADPKKPEHWIMKQFIEVIDTMCETAMDMDAILEYAGLSRGFQKTPQLKAILELLSYKELFEEAVMISYLRKTIRIDAASYDLLDCGKEDRREINDRNALLKIVQKDTGKPLAWVCVLNNLYLVAKKVKNPDGNTWSPSKEYYWRYISPEGYGKELPLGELKHFPDAPIVLDECLSEILPDDEPSV